MNDIVKLINNNEKYPPSVELWNNILKIVKDKKNNKDISASDHDMLYAYKKMEQELTRYKTPLPEPEIVRFMYNNQLYYIDHHGNIYGIDKYSSMTGNLVGKIENNNVYINNICVYTIKNVDTTLSKLKNGEYYTNDTYAYKGFHKKLNILYTVGKIHNDVVKLI